MKNAANIQTIDKAKHSKLRLKPNPDFVHSKDSNLVAVTLSELGACVSNFPVILIQNPEDKRYMLAALLGLRAGENMLYNQKGWEGTYVPMAIVRHPFVIGFNDKKPESEEFTTCIDINHPFLNEDEGMPLFTEAGEETDFLKSRHQVLHNIFEAEKLTERFIQKLLELDLLTTVELVLQDDKNELRKVAGVLTVNEIKLKSLTTEQLQDLHNQDFLPACYLMLVSLYQINQLIKLSNAKGTERITAFQIEFGHQKKEEAAKAANQA